MSMTHPARAHRFPTLLSPLELGPLRLRNRLVMGSMHMGGEDHPADVDALAAFLGERARGGAGLIVTGGVSPSPEGILSPGARMFDAELAAAHRAIPAAVHAEGGAVILQLLHAGRYATTPEAVSASATQAPISPIQARAMADAQVRRTIEDFAAAAARAIEAGYDGVEIMGSEGYLLNQFLAPRTNHREDAWGGDAQRRRAFPVAVTRAVRAAIGTGRLLSFRISVLDLVEEGQTWEETLALAHDLEDAGADVLSTGVGWHESRIPTIVTSVPRGAFLDTSARLRAAVSTPVIAANRLHDPAAAERALAEGRVDLISMARPLLADALLPARLAAGEEDLVIPCISCNQACLDRVFSGKPAGCLVNPRAGREREIPLPLPRVRPRRVAVIGGGAAGCEAAVTSAAAGHAVTLYEQEAELGGQFRYAAAVPGKEDYALALESWRARLAAGGVQVRTGARIEPGGAHWEEILASDRVILSTGVRPRVPEFAAGAADRPAGGGPRVLTYAQWFDLRRAGIDPAARRVAVVGAGGIGVDVAIALTAPTDPPLARDADAWREHWGVEDPAERRGAVERPAPYRRTTEVHVLQRREGRIGAGLGKTTGWVHRAELKRAGVIEHAGVAYLGVEADGLRIREDGQERTLPVDLVVLCAGQEAEDALAAPLRAARPELDLQVIGGARLAGELDAERAIREAMEAALADA